MATGLKPGPVTRVCHVCGRQYGLSSFDIHLKQCKKLWVAQEELKPKHERRPIPKTPPGLDELRGGNSFGDGGKLSREEVETLNRAAQESFNVHGMEKCENCGRTFAEGRLAIHSKSCHGNNIAKRVGEGAAPRNRKEPEVEYGRAKQSDRPSSNNGPTSVEKRSNVRPPVEVPPSDPSSTRGTTSSSSASELPAASNGTRALSGSLASNRKKVPSQDPGNPAMRQQIQSPLATKAIADINREALKQEIQGKEHMLDIIQAKLDTWETTTLSTLQEIRDLKNLFADMRS